MGAPVTLVDKLDASMGTAGSPLVISGALTADQTVDLNKVAGVAVKTGSGTSTGVIRVELPTNGTGIVGIAGNSVANITTATTTTVKSGAGTLHGINVNTKGTVASTVTVYDNTAASGTKLATLDSLNLAGWNQYDVNFATGLTIVTTGTVAPDITVSYR